MASKSSRSSSAKRKRSAATTSQTPWGLIGASALLGLFVIGVIAFAVSTSGKSVEQRIAGVKTETFKAGEHTAGIDDTVKYDSIPPLGGEHNGIWQNCGVYDQPIADAKAVHSLEHGAVWITYQPGLAASEVATLATSYVDGQDYMLLSPEEGQAAPIVVTAWGRQITTSDPKDSRISEFIKAFKNGPTTPERGASCDNGVGTPTDRQATVNPQYAQLQQGATPAPSESVAPTTTPSPAAS